MSQGKAIAKVFLTNRLYSFVRVSSNKPSLGVFLRVWAEMRIINDIKVNIKNILTFTDLNKRQY